MADQAGCTIQQLIASMSGYELNLRITNRLIKEGYTFDPAKITELKEKERKAAADAFMQRAHAHWNRK